MFVDFRLVGKSPLLIHADHVLSRDMLSEYRKRPKNGVKGVAGDDRSPPWSCVTCFYHEQFLTWPPLLAEQERRELMAALAKS